MSWWRQNWRWMLAIGSTITASILVLAYLLLRKHREASSLRARLQLQRTFAKVSGLEADKMARAAELEENTQKAAELDARIADAKRATVAVVKSVDALTDENVAEEFKKLGY